MKIATEDDGGYLLAIIGIASTVGRLLFGFLSDKSFVNRLWLYNTCLTICGLSTLLSFLATTYTLMAIYAAVFGVTCGTNQKLH